MLDRGQVLRVTIDAEFSTRTRCEDQVGEGRFDLILLLHLTHGRAARRQVGSEAIQGDVVSDIINKAT